MWWVLLRPRRAPVSRPAMGTWGTFGLLLQMLVALAVVLAVMWLAARLVRTVGPARNEVLLELVARQQVGRASSVAVVRVADQALVVGVTDEQVSLLAEVELEQVQQALEQQELARAARREHRQNLLPGQASGQGLGSAGPLGAAGEGKGKLHGSIVAPSTWKQAVEALRERTARRG